MRGTISATLTPAAYKIYEMWSKDRVASKNISRAMVESAARESLIQALTAQRNIYRARNGAFRRLWEEIDAGLCYQKSLRLPFLLQGIMHLLQLGNHSSIVVVLYPCLE